MMMIRKFSFLLLILSFFIAFPVLGQTKNLLSPEETLWLESRNNTIVVYPEKNNPPFSYKSAGGSIQGLVIDYIELIAEKIGAKVTYLLPQSRNQILEDFAQGKGDVIAGLMETDDKVSSFIFTDSFVTVPTVIVVRKDFGERKVLSLNDFNGKRVSVLSGSALQSYVSKNYPRVIVEDVTDNEVSLQQVVLGEVDAAVMDVASLSFYLSKQVLNSVKVVGNVGLDYKPAFALMKDHAVLQAILDKGMAQISSNDRNILTNKWVVVPSVEKDSSLLTAIAQDGLKLKMAVAFLVLCLVIVSMMLLKRRNYPTRHFGGVSGVEDLKEEVFELERMNQVLSGELKEIKEEEDKIQAKIESLGNRGNGSN